MSSYYHQFSIGFNWFYITGPAFLLIGVLLDAMTRLYLAWWQPKGAERRMLAYRLRKDESRETVKFHEFVKTVYWIATTAAFMAMVWTEASAGIIQLFDNSLTRYESGAWSLFGLAMTISAIFLVYSWLGYVALSHGATWTGVAICFVVDMPILIFQEMAEGFSKLDAKRRQNRIHALKERKLRRDKRMAARGDWYRQLKAK